MSSQIAKVRHVFVCENRPKAIRYAVKLALMVVACLRIVTLIGNSGA